jgi:outer membrane protein assembly factor BamB
MFLSALLFACGAGGVAGAAPAAGGDIDAGLVARWQFTADRLSGQSFAPLAGKLPAIADQPVKFSADAPKALRLDVVTRNKVKTGQFLTVTDDLAAAGMQAGAITVEAWVQVDSPEKLGGFACAIQENAPQRGWVLGNCEKQFCFAVATAAAGRLNYLKAAAPMRPGYWYHVVGTYDGAAQKLYVDGRQAAASAELTGPVAYPDKGALTLAAWRNQKQCYPLTGQLERVSIWSRALSAAEVRSLFDARKEAFPYAQPEPPEAVTDWPTYRRDNRRSATAPEPLRLPLALQWVHKPGHPPAPAWPEPAGADPFHRIAKLEPRVIYDRAFHAVTVGDRVLFGSSAEDKVVCLDARTGRCLWQFFTEGPVRLAPAIAEGRAVVGCDDGRVYCLALDDGKLIWSHRPPAEERLIAGNERIISLYPVRTGPIIDGRTVHVCTGLFPLQGVFQEKLDLATGESLGGGEITVSPQGYPSLVLGELATPTGWDRKGAVLTKARRRGKIPADPPTRPDMPYATIAAGAAEFGGGDGLVAAFETGAPEAPPLWSAKVEGRAYGLAAARGRLLVSTDAGLIYCFAERQEKETDDRGGAEAQRVKEEAKEKARGTDYRGSAVVSSAAQRIVKLAEGPRGYCLLLGDDAAPLAAELAKRTDWRIVCRIPTPARAAEAHRVLDAAGLHGVRVAVHQGPPDKMAYADGLFNVVVDVAAALGGKPASSRAEALRVTRPGSLAVLGGDDAALVRPPGRDGTGEWTHTYADPGNTASSGDKLVAGKLAMQWFGLPGPREMLDRHHRNTPPLSKAGRLFVPGDGVVFGVDAFNGTILWRSQAAGARRLGAFLDCGAMCVDDRSLYVAGPRQCLALDVRTGEARRTLDIPAGLAGAPGGNAATPPNWGYVARTGEMLVGSACLPTAAYRAVSREADMELWYDHMKLVTSTGLFALDAASGKPRWTYAPDKAVIINTTIAIGGGRAYFVESRCPAAVADKLGRMEMETFQPGPNFLVAINLADGRQAWRHPLDLADCRLIAYVNYADETLILSGNRYVDKKLWYFLQALDAADGRQKWRQSHDSLYGPGGGHGEQNRHPVIVGQTVFSWPLRYDLRTGRPVEGWQFARQGHGCGNVSASADCLFWRGKNPWKQDLRPGGGPSPINLVSRPGCFINILPANGLVLIPEASSGCTCDYPIQASMALAPVPPRR